MKQIAKWTALSMAAVAASATFPAVADGSPIANEVIDSGDGDSTFDVDSTTAPASGSVTQTVTATFDTSFATEKFFKAAIEFPQPEDPGEEPEE